MESKVYNQEGKEVRTITLPESIFGVKWNSDMVHQVVVSMNSTARKNIAHTKTRGEVSGGGKKPWQQKGTGRARHGSIRSPLWVGGGVTHGPRNDKNYSRKVNRKMKTGALFSVLSRKVKDGEVLFLDSLSFSAPKTAEARKTLSQLSQIKGFSGLLKKTPNSALIALSGTHRETNLSLRNFSNIMVDEVRNLNPVEVLNYKYLVINEPEKAFASFESRLSKK